jgi:hypothetical protein
MARIGKIARLPRDLRHQLNTRLQDGAEGNTLLPWLNALPEVQALLAARFDARPINDQNLSAWRHGGYQEWLAHQDILAQAQELAARRQELQAAAPGQSFSDHLAAVLAFRYAALLAAPGVELDDDALRQLRALGRASQSVVQLRRSDQNAARLQMETQRWELDHQQILAQNAADLKRRQKDALAAPVLAAIKTPELIKPLGDSPLGRFAMQYLLEIETCQAPAHFQSKVLTQEALAALQREADEKRKNPPVRRTAVQEAIAMIREMDQAMDATGNTKPAPRKKPSPAAPKPRPTVQRPPRRAPLDPSAAIVPPPAEARGTSGGTGDPPVVSGDSPETLTATHASVLTHL